ncbi:hypothetical protein ACI77I_11495 [Pseudomonas sp. D47]|uniref:hypothetical protein n=1 Tax=Pseudomonas sp. D47 TaxID=3159447 RepID=UPI00387B768C
MISDQTISVSRELLERIADEANHMLGFTYAANYDECRSAVDELRALLDSPAIAICRGCFTEQSMGHACKTCAEVEAQPAAQPQGEPVAWIVTDMNGDNYFAYDRQTPNDKPLYAEQPAPVAAAPNYGSLDAVQRLALCRGDMPVAAPVVPELTPELRWILGQMCFQHIHTAQALRLMGHQIARKAEDEQAVTIYWMLGHYLKDPANWRDNAAAEMKAAAPKA